MKRIYWLSFYACYIATSPYLYGASGYGIDVELQSPSSIEAQPGSVITESIWVTNQSKKPSSFKGFIELPSGWSTLPFDLPPFTLESRGSTVQLIPIKIPNTARAGEYHFKYVVQGLDDPNFISTTHLKIVVLPQVGLYSIVESAPKYVRAGDSYQVKIKVTNTSNIENEILLDVKNHGKSQAKPLSYTSINLAPHESKTVEIEILSDKNLKETASDHICIEASLKIQPDIKKYHSVNVEVFPITTDTHFEYNTIPTTTTVGFGQRNDRTELYIEQVGQGFLDEHRKHKLDFYAKIPFLHEAHVARDLGLNAGRGHAHYKTSSVDAFIGDGTYSLTPLTMAYQYGRGGSLSIKPTSVGAKGIYVKQQSCERLKSMGGTLFYQPSPLMKMAVTAVETDLSQTTKNNFYKGKKDSLTTSFYTSLNPKNSQIELEYANSNLKMLPSRKQYAYLARANTKLFDSVYLNLQKIGAAPNFVGYYRDNSSFDTSLSFPVYKTYRGNLSYNNYSSNLDKISDKGAATRRFSLQGGLSNAFSPTTYGSISVNQIQSKDLLIDQGYRTNFFSFNLGKTFNRWSLQGNMDQGWYKSAYHSKENHTWQNYYLYSYFNPIPWQTYALYTRIGCQAMQSTTPWTRTYGTSARLYLSDNFNFQAIYEYSDLKQARHYASSTLQYKFFGSQTLDFRGQYVTQEGKKRVCEYLITYSIPWGIPVSKKGNRGGVKGQVTRLSENGRSVPYAHLPLNCNGKRFITNAKGEFGFSHLPPGECLITAEDAETSFAPSIPLPHKILVKKGKVSKVNIDYKPAARIQGDIKLFKKTSFYEPIEYDKQWEGATIILTSLDHSDEQIATSNSLGQFSLAKLTPGRYKLNVYANLPAHHLIEPQEIKIDIKPGQSLDIPIKITPKERKIRYID